MHLVDDVHLIGADAGRISRLIPQVADVVHAVVGGGVDLHHVQDGTVVDAPAHLALAAGVAALVVGAVDCLGENLGAGGLAGTAGAGEQIGMAHTVGCDLVLQRGHDVLLTHHVLKAAGPPFAVQCPVHAGTPFGKYYKKRTGPQRNAPPPLRRSAYGCRLTAAHAADHLMLLGSPPDMVHGASSRRARIRMPNSARFWLCPNRYIIHKTFSKCNLPE